MIYIEDLRNYFQQDTVFITKHAEERCRRRNIKAKDIRIAVNNGEIIEQYPDDFPYPSCLILGTSFQGKPLHVVMSDEGNSSRVITAYYPDEKKWDANFKVRKEDS